MKNCNLLIPRLPKRTSKLQEKLSASKENKRTSITSKHEIFGLFLFLSVIFAPESGFTDLIEPGSGSETLVTGQRVFLVLI
jgi:hypothetical protein